MSRRQEQAEKDAGSRWGRNDRTVRDPSAGERDGTDAQASAWDRDLDDAPMEELQELAADLGIDGYESLGREELVRRIRRETGAEL